jgi:hypothetical protein
LQLQILDVVEIFFQMSRAWQTLQQSAFIRHLLCSRKLIIANLTKSAKEFLSTELGNLEVSGIGAMIQNRDGRMT